MIVVRLALPVRSPRPLSVPCTWPAPASTAAIELATAQPVSSWQWMPIVTSVPTWACTAPTISLDLVGQRPAVGVAQHDVAGALDDRRLERPQRELGVGLVAVEEVLHVDEHPPALAARNSTESAIIASPSSSVVCSAWVTWYSELLATMHTADVPRLDEVAQRGVVVDLAAGPAGRAEGDERAGRESSSVAGAGEELDVLRVGARPAALDEVHAEVSSCSAMRSLSSTVAETPSTCRPSRSVVSKTSTVRRCCSWWAPMCRGVRTVPENGRSRPEGGFDVHVAGHVHYGMMMIAAAAAVGAITAPFNVDGLASTRASDGRSRRLRCGPDRHGGRSALATACVRPCA